MHIVCEYKNNLLTSLFCHTFDNRDKHKLQRKNCRSYFLNITKSPKMLKFLRTFNLLLYIQ